MVADIGKAQLRFSAHQGVDKTINAAAFISTVTVTQGEGHLKQAA